MPHAKLADRNILQLADCLPQFIDLNGVRFLVHFHKFIFPQLTHLLISKFVLPEGVGVTGLWPYTLMVVPSAESWVGLGLQWHVIMLFLPKGCTLPTYSHFGAVTWVFGLLPVFPS